MTVILWKTHQPARFAQASARESQRLAQKFVSGRAGKDLLMPRVREVAAAGRCDGWADVLHALELVDVDVSPLRVWGTARDKAEIDRMCARARGRGSRLGSRRFGLGKADSPSRS